MARSVLPARVWITTIAFCLFETIIYGQTPQPARIIGEVTSMDAAAHNLAVKTDKGDSVSVKLGEKTLYLRVPPGEKDLKNASKIALTGIGSGDRVLARGALSDDAKTLTATSVIVMTKADLAQKHEHDRAEWQRRGITGTVTAVNSDSHEFTVSVRAAGQSKSVVVEAGDKVDVRRYAPDSVRFSDARPSSFAELKVGDHVRVLGEKNADETRMQADAIVSGSFRQVAATILSIDASANEIKVTDLATKKPLTVRVIPDTVVRRLPLPMATMLARRYNPEGARTLGAGGARGGQAGAAAQRVAGAPREPGGPGGGGPGGPGAPGMGARAGSGGGDMQQMLERLQPIPLAELKPGDAVIISSTTGADPSRVTAITLVAGVEPLLASAPQGGSVISSGWTLDMGLPE